MISRMTNHCDLVLTCFFFEPFRGFVLCCRILQLFVFAASKYTAAVIRTVGRRARWFMGNGIKISLLRLPQ